MAREMGSTHTGFSWTVTDGGRRFMVGKDAVHDSLAWGDLDGDGCIDLIAIATASGNYEDTDHELVGIHVPSGTVAWRALPGEVSKKISLVESMLVASSNAATQLRGLDPRSGRQQWALTLPDRLKEDPFDGDDRAPAIAPVGGSICAFECHDDSWHLLDVRTGQIVKSGEGKLVPLGAGVPGLVALTAGDSDDLELWDVLRMRCILKLSDVSQIRVVPGAGSFGVIWHGPLVKDGAWGVQARFFDAASMGEVGKTSLVGVAKAGRGDDDDDDDDGAKVDVGSGEYGVIGGFLLGGNRLFYGSRYGDGGPYVGTVVPNKRTTMQTIPAPKPGFRFRSVIWAAPVLVTAWQKTKGTEKLLVVGHDPSTLAPIWQVDDLGGRSLDNVLITAGGAVLVPNNPGPNHNEYDQHNNRCAIRHIDPATGTVVTEYPVEDVECVEVHGNFLCGAPTYFSGGLPVAYEVVRRERVL